MYYLLEWIAFHLRSGADRIRIYDNDSEDGTSDAISCIGNRYPVEIVRWPSVEGVSPQVSAYEHALRTLGPQSEFIVFIDSDEFLFTADWGRLAETFAAFSDDVGAIAVNQRVFGSSGRLHYEPDLVTSRFVRRAPTGYEENKCFKTVGRASAVAGIKNCHEVHLASGRYVLGDGTDLVRAREFSGKADRVSSGPIRLHHYILKSRGEFETKRQRGGGMGPTLAARLSRHRNDRYFTGRDPHINGEEDRSLADRRGEIVALMTDLVALCERAMTPAIRQIHARQLHG